MALTDFGFRSVEAEEKASLVRGVFDSVAAKYDVMNDAMSLGVHRLWKKRFVEEAQIRAGMRCLDVAGGTGDIAFRLKERGAQQVTVCDINHAMLREGQRRADDRAAFTGLDFICGNAESLPFPDNHFQLYTIAFGIRNVTYKDKALAEAHRVLAPGGRFLCLEFSRVQVDALAKLYELYSFHLIPQIGGMIAGDRDSYQYLVESIKQFPDQEAFAAMVRGAGFAQVRHTSLSAGVVAIHSGYKL